MKRTPAPHYPPPAYPSLPRKKPRAQHAPFLAVMPLLLAGTAGCPGDMRVPPGDLMEETSPTFEVAPPATQEGGEPQRTEEEIPIQIPEITEPPADQFENGPRLSGDMPFPDPTEIELQQQAVPQPDPRIPGEAPAPAQPDPTPEQ